MQTKLTLKLDSDVIEKAKVYAKRNNASLSKMIEQYLEYLVVPGEKETEISPLVKSISGVISLEDAEGKEDYIEYISRKYK